MNKKITFLREMSCVVYNKRIITNSKHFSSRLVSKEICSTTEMKKLISFFPRLIYFKFKLNKVCDMWDGYQ